MAAISWKSQRLLGSADDDLVLNRLTRSFQEAQPELNQLVQEKYAAMHQVQSEESTIFCHKKAFV